MPDIPKVPKNQFDAVLSKLLATPPQPHKPVAKKRTTKLKKR
jgi:hypothetical protein